MKQSKIKIKLIKLFYGFILCNVTDCVYGQLHTIDSLAANIPVNSQIQLSSSAGSVTVGTVQFSAIDLNQFDNGNIALIPGSASTTPATFLWGQIIQNNTTFSGIVSVETNEIFTPDRDKNSAFYDYEPNPLPDETETWDIASLQQVYGQTNNLYRGMSSNSSPTGTFTMNLYFTDGNSIITGANGAGNADIALLGLVGLGSSDFQVAGIETPVTTTTQKFGPKISGQYRVINNVTVGGASGYITIDEQYSSVDGILGGVGIEFVGGGYASNTPLYGLQFTTSPATTAQTLYGILASPTPEPCSILALLTGGSTLLYRIRRRKREASKLTF